MNTRKTFGLIIIFGLMSLFCVGCGNKVPMAGESQGYVKVIEELPREDRLQVFDDKLAAISDEASAKDAVLAFADYVDSRVKKDEVSAFGSAKSGLNISESLINKITKIEVAERMKGIGAMGINTPKITPEKMADAINSLSPTPEAKNVPEEIIKSAQKEVRKELPHIAKDDSETMTPLESLVIGYVLYGTDDGGSQAGTVDLGVSGDKVNQFVEKIIE